MLYISWDGHGRARLDGGRGCREVLDYKRGEIFSGSMASDPIRRFARSGRKDMGKWRL